jgi:hypothetical protein
MIYGAIAMFLIAAACMARSIGHKDSEAAIAAGMFSLAGCVLLR